jgi:integration host factor subunit beta
MTKADLINLIAADAGISRVKAESVVNTVFESMVDALIRNERVELRGFGTFTVRQYEAYEGRNPRTGSPIAVHAKRMPHFKNGRGLKQKMNP